MPGEKRFRTSFMGGFKKSDVNTYIEKILKEFDEKLKSKDDEISVTRNQIRELRFKYDELMKKSDEVTDARTKIADVLIQAQEKADRMLDNARLESIDEKKKLEESVEQEKEKLVDIRTEIKSLKGEIVKLLKKYEEQLSDIAREEEEAEAEAAAASEQDAAVEQDTAAGDGTEDIGYDPGFTRY